MKSAQPAGMRQAFAPLAGAIARDCLRPSGLGRLLPSLLLLTACVGAGLRASSAALLPGALQPLVAALFAGPVLGFEALRERDGAAPPLREAARFALRYGAVLASLGLPLSLAVEWTLGRGLADLHPLLPAAAPLLAWLVLASGLAIAAGALALLVATHAGEASGLFDARTWREALLARPAELPAFLAAALGAAALAALSVVPLLLLASSAAAALSPRVGIWLMLLAWSSPLTLGGLLAARLAGAYAACAPGRLRAEPPAATTASVPPYIQGFAPLTPARLPDAAPIADAVELVRAIQGLATKGQTDLPGAIAEAEALLAAEPRAAGVMAELAKLYRRAGRHQEATELASRAIAVALSGGMSPVAVAVYLAFVGERQRLSLEPAVRLQLGKTLAAQGHAAEAAWCLTAP